MYLTQLVIDCMDRSSMRALHDIYRLHQLVMSGFKHYAKPHRVLFRLEPEVRGNFVTLLVQSHAEPLWERPDRPQALIVKIQIKEFNLRFRQGANFRFRLRANPVVKKDGKRQGLIRDEALAKWLMQRAERIGVEFPSVLAVDEGYVTGSKKVGDKTDRVNIKTVRYEGSLRITDTNRFSEAFRLGVGPAKGFGCGLISLARV